MRQTTRSKGHGTRLETLRHLLFRSDFFGFYFGMTLIALLGPMNACGSSLASDSSRSAQICHATLVDRTKSVWITNEPSWPHVIVCNFASPVAPWRWKVYWHNFNRSGSAQIPDTGLDMFQQLQDFGGEVELDCCESKPSQPATITMVMHIRGKNPSTKQISDYIRNEPSPFELERIAEVESSMRQFDDAGEPLASSDGRGGYGIFQLTNPAPTAPQAWNWKRNVDGGASLISIKSNDAQQYLGQHEDTPSTDEVARERISLWNGGHYYSWQPEKKQFVRKNFLCDPGARNIGWSMEDPDNKGMTLEQLRNRDGKNFSRASHLGDHWRRTGVCYADHLLG